MNTHYIRDYATRVTRKPASLSLRQTGPLHNLYTQDISNVWPMWILLKCSTFNVQIYICKLFDKMYHTIA